MKVMRRVSIALLLAALSAVWSVAAAAPASASCAAPARQSPHAFTGVVVGTANDGRTATVRTDDGRTVKIIGAESGRAVTSVDRGFRTGYRYEFHPLNDASPYRDNACTATRELGRAPVDDRSYGSDAGGLGRLRVFLLLAASATVLLGGILATRAGLPRHLADRIVSMRTAGRGA